MGSVIRIQCNKCEIDRTEYVDSGELGTGSELCACYHCHRYVLKKLKRWTESFDRPNLKCPYCHKVIKPLNYGDSCPICPICASEIKISFGGLWD